MLLTQTDVAVDEELEKVIISIFSSTETDIGNNESGYEYSPEKLQKPPVNQRRVYCLEFECTLFQMLKLTKITLFLMKFDAGNLIKSL